MLKHGSLVISLDLEMMWGCHDWTTPARYGASNIRNVRLVIDKLLQLFDQYGIHATVATVGLLFCKDKTEINNFNSHKRPSYLDVNKSPFKESYINDIQDIDAELYFAPDIINKLKHTPNIEIGSHTFSHYFCWEPGQTIDEFISDIVAMSEISLKNNIEVRSVVLPKNQISSEYVNELAKYGIICYRGNAVRYFSEPKSKLDYVKNSICRFIDAYINIGGNSSISYDKIERHKQLVNVIASRFVRPYNPKLFFIEKLRLNRIKREMEYAARNGEMYHLWWHPHNFGANIEANFTFIIKVLKCYNECHEKYGMKSYSMGEVAKQILNKTSNK